MVEQHAGDGVDVGERVFGLSHHDELTKKKTDLIQCEHNGNQLPFRELQVPWGRVSMFFVRAEIVDF